MNTWLAEDPELLQATLDIVNAWDVHTNGVWEATSEESEHGDGAKEPEKSSTGNTRRRESKLSTNQRRREEILELRDQVLALEAQVMALRTLRKPRDLSSSLWRNVAENQHRLRQQAELERVKLRELVRAHVSITDGMNKLMRRSKALQLDETIQALRCQLASRQPPLKAFGTDQFQRIELIYSRMDDVFAHQRFHDGSHQFVETDIVEDLEREVVLQFRETWTVPFDTLAVLDALWEYTKQRYEIKWKDQGQHIVVDTDDVFVSQFALQAVIDTFCYGFTGQLALRRFADGATAKTPAIVTNMASQPNLDANGHMQVWMTENSCIRVLPVVRSDEWSSASRIECTFHVSVKFNDDDEITGRQHAAALVHTVLHRLQADVETKQNRVEAILLQAQGSVQ